MTEIALHIAPIGACAAAALTGALFKPGAWYAGLNKPSFTPPNLAFPIVWTLLYVLMALAAGRAAAALAAGAGAGMDPQAAFRGALGLGFWALQITLNALWSPIFFGLHRPRIALAVIGLMWAALAASAWGFAGVDGTAALMMLPALLWGALAAALNLAVMRLNPPSAFGRGAA